MPHIRSSQSGSDRAVRWLLTGATSGAISREHACYLAIPVNERDGGTVYNTICYFGPDGALLAKHRKLQATGGERIVWGSGDGSTLAVIDTPFGRVGGLICWENYMPLARAAMYAKGIDVWVACTWDDNPHWVSTLQHIAREGRTYVIDYTDDLANPNWQSLTNIVGNGLTRGITNTAPGVLQRFYRFKTL